MRSRYAQEPTVALLALMTRKTMTVLFRHIFRKKFNNFGVVRISLAGSRRSLSLRTW